MECVRCGTVMPKALIQKRKSRGNKSLLCQSCEARPASTVKVNGLTCKPHHGLFTDNDEPLDKKGRPFMPGFRKCGHSDCVEPRHIISALELERLAPFRSGMSMQDKIIRLRAEAGKLGYSEWTR